MKKLIFGLFLTILINSASAHIITPQCWSEGRFRFLVTSVHSNMSVHVINGNWDTTISIKSTSFAFSIPQKNMGITNVKFRFSDGYDKDVKTVPVTCASLPLKFKDFKCRYVGDRLLLINFTLFEVTNVRQINIRVSDDDGKTFRNIGVVLPDNLVEEKQYALKLKY